MQNQIAVRRLDRRQNLEKEPYACPDPEVVRVAVAIDRLALDQLEDEVGLTALGDTRVEQASDIGMRELGENAAFAAKSFGAAACNQREIEKLDRHPACEAAIAAMGQPHAAHFPLAQRGVERVAADNTTGELRFARQRRPFKERVPIDRAFFREERLEFVGQTPVVPANLCQAIRAARAVELEQVVKQRAQDLPAGPGDACHGRPMSLPAPSCISTRLSSSRPRSQASLHHRIVILARNPTPTRPRGRDAAAAEPSANRAARFAPTLRAWPQCRRTRSRRRT